MDKSIIAKGSRQEPFIMVYHYMLESDLLTDNEFKLYLILLKYADSENKCFPSIKTLSKTMGKAKSRIQELLNKLQEKGLLIVENRKTNNGDYTSNLYTILDYKELWTKKESIDDATDQSNNQSNAQNNQHCTVNDTLTKVECQEKTPTFTRGMLDDIYDFEILKHDRPTQEDLFNSFIEIALEVLNSTAKTIRINKEDKPAEVVKSRFLKLQYPHLVHIADTLSNQTTEVKNIRGYIMTSLYNSYTTLELHYTNKVNCDLNKEL